MNEATTSSDKKPIGLLYVIQINSIFEYRPISDEPCYFKETSNYFKESLDVFRCEGFNFSFSRGGSFGVECMAHLYYKKRGYDDKLIYSLEELYNICFEHVLYGGTVTGIDDVIDGVVSE